MKSKFFYNYNVIKDGQPVKFNFGLIEIVNDSRINDCDLAFDTLLKEANDKYPDADDINLITFTPMCQLL